MVNGWHLYSAFIQSAVQPTLSQSPVRTRTLAPTAIGRHARRRPARREPSGVRRLAQGAFDRTGDPLTARRLLSPPERRRQYPLNEFENFESHPVHQLRPQSPQLRPQSPQLRPHSPQLRPQSPQLRPQSPQLRPQCVASRPRCAATDLPGDRRPGLNTDAHQRPDLHIFLSLRGSVSV